MYFYYSSCYYSCFLEKLQLVNVRKKLGQVERIKIGLGQVLENY